MLADRVLGGAYAIRLASAVPIAYSIWALSIMVAQRYRLARGRALAVAAGGVLLPVLALANCELGREIGMRIGVEEHASPATEDSQIHR